MSQEAFTERGERSCEDVVVNCLGELEKPVYRPCNPEEKRRISLLNVFIKQAISIVLLIVACWFLYIERLQTSPPRYFEDAFNVQKCLDDEAANMDSRYSDGGVQFCNIKLTMVILSLVLLIPYWLQTQAQVAVIMVSSIEPSVLVPISDGEYAGFEPSFDLLFNSNQLKRLVLGLPVLGRFVISLIRVSTKEKSWAFFFRFLLEVFWKFFVFVFPDLMLTFVLFPLSLFVMEGSGTTDELFVNLVAVQIFAEIDDILVRLLVAPREAVGDTLRLYSKPQKSALKAKYQPLDEYLLSLNRHNFGFKGAKSRMAELYEYDGFHFVSEA